MLEGLPGDEEVEHSSVSWESGGSLPPPTPTPGTPKALLSPLLTHTHYIHT